MFDCVRSKTSRIVDESLREKTLQFIDSLEIAVDLAEIKFDLPRLACDFYDGSYMEWVFIHFTVGFNISMNKSEEGWFLISDEDLGNIDKEDPNLFMLPSIIAFIKRYGDE